MKAYQALRALWLSGPPALCTHIPSAKTLPLHPGTPYCPSGVLQRGHRECLPEVLGLALAHLLVLPQWSRGAGGGKQVSKVKKCKVPVTK